MSQRSLDELILIVKDERPDWKSISLKLPLIDVLPASFTIDEGNGRQPQKRTKMNISDIDLFEVIITGFYFTQLWPIMQHGSFFNNWMSIIIFFPLGFYGKNLIKIIK